MTKQLTLTDKTKKRWAVMTEIGEGSGSVDNISVAAMESLGIPYYALRLEQNCDEFYKKKSEKNAIGEVVEERRVHLNAVPNRLLNILYHITPKRDRHHYLERLRSIGIIEDCDEFPREYPRYEREFMIAIDANNQLMEMPENLVNALKAGVDFSGGLWYQQRLKAYYAPFRVRAVLYHTAPEDERDEFWLNDKERERAESIGFSGSILNAEARKMLVDRRDEKQQIMDIDDDLLEEILAGSIESLEELQNFLAVE